MFQLHFLHHEKKKITFQNVEKHMKFSAANISSATFFFQNITAGL